MVIVGGCRFIRPPPVSATYGLWKQWMFLSSTCSLSILRQDLLMSLGIHQSALLLIIAESSGRPSRNKVHFYSRWATVSAKKRSGAASTKAGRKQVLSCHLCPYTTNLRRSIKDHMLTHTGEKSFECKVCLTKFALRFTLKRHMRTHTGEKPYKCEQCPYRSASSSSLVCHMRNHTGDKPYACGTCPYLTSRYCDIVKHLRIHTGDKPFKCDWCTYAAASQSTLNRHIRSMHGEK